MTESNKRLILVLCKPNYSVVSSRNVRWFELFRLQFTFSAREFDSTFKTIFNYLRIGSSDVENLPFSVSGVTVTKHGFYLTSTIQIVQIVITKFKMTTNHCIPLLYKWGQALGLGTFKNNTSCWIRKLTYGLQNLSEAIIWMQSKIISKLVKCVCIRNSNLIRIQALLLNQVIIPVITC